MPVVLGIDAAWTAGNPSGVAVVGGGEGRWILAGLASSYRQFESLTPNASVAIAPNTGTPLDASRLLRRARELAGAPVDLVAVDMPLANTPIVARRVSDNLVSAAYGARHAGTHTPNANRPGPISTTLSTQFAAEGFALCTTAITPSALIEVYPHPALIELARAERRLPYKAQKARNYWPEHSAAQRRANLLDQWQAIITLLDAEIAGVAAALPLPAPDARTAVLKAYEDALDAVVCAWVGICALQGRATPFGDAESAIWIPRPRA